MVFSAIRELPFIISWTIRDTKELYTTQYFLSNILLNNKVFFPGSGQESSKAYLTKENII